MIVQPITTIT